MTTSVLISKTTENNSPPAQTAAPRISILGANFNTHNMGVGALAAGTLTCICHAFPNARISILDYAKTSSTHRFFFRGNVIEIPFVNIRFSKKFYLRNNIAFLILLSCMLKLIPFKALRRKLTRLNSWLWHLEQSDLVASAAGGDSFSDIYGMGRFLYVSLPQILALLSGKRLMLLPQTFGPFKGRLARWIAKYILSHSNAIYTRDYQGLIDVKKLLGCNDSPEKLSFCYDVGFVVEPLAPANPVSELFLLRDRASVVVGLNISGLLAIGGYTQKNMFGLNVDYKRLILSIITLLITDKGATVLLVPHVFGYEEGNPESDTVICRAIFEELHPLYGDQIRLVTGTYNQNEIKHIIGRCDFFIGSRMHACIAALSQHIPAMAIAYSDKFIGVMQTIGVESLVADARTMDEQSIVDAVGRAYDQRNTLRAQLGDKMIEVRRTVLRLFAGLNEVGSIVPCDSGSGNRLPV